MGSGGSDGDIIYEKAAEKMSCLSAKKTDSQVLPTTPGMSDLADFRKRKTLQLKKLQRFLVPIQF